MGAMAPVSSWILEDDLLLKNAVEAGASLESLAKGAVQFSRRFTVQELQERWYSLLYDPAVSADAAARMYEFECSSTLPSTTKENETSSGKRKFESVRKCYYAMRKRICNEPFDSVDLSFLGAPGNTNVAGNGDEPPSADFMLGESIQNHIRLEESNFDMIDCSFPNIGCGGVTAHAKKIHHTFEGNLSVMGNCSTVEELGQPREVCNLFEADDLEAKPQVMFDQINVDETNVFSGFGGGQVFNLPVSDRGASFHNFGYSSPLPQLPNWSTIEGNSDAKLKNQMSCDNVKNSAPSTDDFFEELSNSLFNFTNEEELLFMDAEGKDAIDRSYIEGLSSLLLDSPNEDDGLNITAPEALVLPDEAQYHCQGPNIHKVCSSEAQMLPYASAVNREFPELRNGVICCMLNTEDPEIPCNDDVFLLSHLPSSSSLSYVTQWKFHEANHPTSSSVKDISGSKKPNDGGGNLMKRVRNKYEQSHLSSQMVGLGSHSLSETGTNLPIGDRGIKFELPNSDSQKHLANVSANNLLPLAVKEEVIQTEQTKKFSYNSADCYIENQDHGFNSLMRCSPKNASSSKQEDDASAAIEKHEELHAALDSIEMTVSEPVVKPSPSDQEEFLSGSDDDVPCFSDVEAMILDMDLSPDDQDLYPSMDVSRYQHEDNKRELIRLEQAADAYMQRAIRSEGALAVLYGRNSKHYIKKPEVLLGRATEDVNVDLDLGRERRANKISRRQAIIKMDDGGSFYLRNIGKYPIFVNGKEVGPGHNLILTSNCLIEIRGMPFVFETNRAFLKQYLKNLAQGSQSRSQSQS